MLTQTNKAAGIKHRLSLAQVILKLSLKGLSKNDDRNLDQILRREAGGIAWRCADSLSLREFLGAGLYGAVPDHSTVSRTRRLIDVETHGEVFNWMLVQLAENKLIDGKTIGVDATTLAHKLEHAVDMKTGAVVGVGVEGGGSGDTTTMTATLIRTAENLERLAETTELREDWMSELVADKGYHSSERLIDLRELKIRTYISEPDRGRRRWTNKRAERDAVYANRRRVRGERGKQLLRQRGLMLERPFAHGLETGGMRRVFLRGRENVLKRMLIHYAALNLGILLRLKFGHGTPRGVGGASDAYFALQTVLLSRQQMLETLRQLQGPFSSPVDPRVP